MGRQRIDWESLRIDYMKNNYASLKEFAEHHGMKWAVRCMHEASMHMFNSFVTLTYDDDHLPEYNSLNYKHFQDFMKRLRKSHNGVRFYMCGEYGEDFSRPHYHALLFNCFFPDRKKHSTGDSGSVIYTSEALTKLWPFGFSSIGDVTFESAAYCSRYIMKKVTGDLAESHYETVDLSTSEVSARVPEFNRMSLKPGIGAEWISVITRMSILVMLLLLVVMSLSPLVS